MQDRMIDKLACAGLIAFVLIQSQINPAWLYDPFGWVDQWAYLGHAHFFPNLRLLLPGHPSGDLLPLILPAAFFHKLLSPVAANFCLDILSTSLVVCVLFLHVRKFADGAAGIIVALLASGYQYLLSALGSSYTDGRVIASYCLGLYLTSLARDAKGRRASLLLLAAGVAAAAMLYTAILSVVYLPIFAIYYVLRFRDAEGPISKQFVRRSLQFVGWFSLGIAGMTALLAALHFSYTGEWFFFKPTLKKLLYFVGGGYTAPPADSWLPDASWLIVPFAVTLACAAALIRVVVTVRRIRASLGRLEEWHIVALLNLVSLAIVLLVELVMHQWPLQFLYFDQTLPVTFLGIGALLGRPNVYQKSSPALVEIVFVGCGSVLGLWLLGRQAYTYATLRDPLVVRLQVTPYSLLATFIVVTAVALYWSNLFRFSRLGVLAYLLVFNVFSFSPTFGPFLCGDNVARIFRPAPLDSSRGNYLTTLQVADFVNGIDPKRECALWFDDAGIFGPFFRQVNAVAYLNDPSKRINREFPRLENFGGYMGSQGREPTANDQILVLSLDPAASRQASAALASYGLSVKSSSSWSLKLGDQVLYAIRIRTS